MKKFIFLGLIMFCVSCFHVTKDAVTYESEEEAVFNTTINSLKEIAQVSENRTTIDSMQEHSGFSKVFGQFNWDVPLDDLKRVIAIADSSLTTQQIDSICVEYYYNCSKSIHDFISDDNKEIIVYRLSRENVNRVGYPILIGDNKAVTISHYLSFLRAHVFQQYPFALFFEKKESSWEIVEQRILIY